MCEILVYSCREQLQRWILWDSKICHPEKHFQSILKLLFREITDICQHKDRSKSYAFIKISLFLFILLIMLGKEVLFNLIPSSPLRQKEITGRDWESNRRPRQVLMVSVAWETCISWQDIPFALAFPPLDLPWPESLYFLQSQAPALC